MCIPIKVEIGSLQQRVLYEYSQDVMGESDSHELSYSKVR
jgi:hypothetical protein